MLRFALRHKLSHKDYSYQPFVSIIIPTYNEDGVIEKRIQNLRDLHYPNEKYEILVVDSGSSDHTRSIVRRISKEGGTPQIRLVCEDQRNGKASAINCGKKHAAGDIILVTDANSVFDERALEELIPHFKDHDVGAVGGRYVVANPETQLPCTEQFYWHFENMLRTGESAADSACLFEGSINAWRKDIVDADVAMISEDLDMSISIRKTGYKVAFEPNALSYEPAPTSFSEQLKQKKRRSVGTIQTIFKHWRYLIVPSDWYRLITFPSHKSLLMFSPFMFVGILLSYVVIWNSSLILSHVFIISGLFLILLFLYLRSTPRLHHALVSSGAKVSLLRVALYVLFDEYLLLLAWKDFFFRRHSVLWEKIDTTTRTSGVAGGSR
jgi:cellulose synthase/poly-beta-1,6-N-acetylglucosamine synthase-like glycosyltransferase